MPCVLAIDNKTMNWGKVNANKKFERILNQNKSVMHNNFRKLFYEIYNSPLDVKGEFVFTPQELKMEEYLRKPLEVLCAYNKYNSSTELLIYIPSIYSSVPMSITRTNSDLDHYYHCQISENTVEIEPGRIIYKYGEVVNKFIFEEFKKDIVTSIPNIHNSYIFNPEVWREKLLTKEQIKQYKHSKREQKIKKLI